MKLIVTIGKLMLLVSAAVSMAIGAMLVTENNKAVIGIFFGSGLLVALATGVFDIPTRKAGRHDSIKSAARNIRKAA